MRQPEPRRICRSPTRRLRETVPETEGVVAPPAVESRDAITTRSRATANNNLPGTGGIIAVTNRVSPTLSSRFYRVRQLP